MRLVDAEVLDTFTPLFRPQAIAVAGASASRVGMGNIFIRRLQAFGYAGPIYPIHPSARMIEGLRAYPSLGATPTPVDYAYIAVPAEQVPGVVRQAAGRVRFAQVVTSGFGEVPEGQGLETELLAAARQAGVRILGPNCLGTYSPRGGLTYVDGVPREAGPVGIIAQSGGLSLDIVRRGTVRGLRFSGVVTLGNSVDVQPSDLLAFYLADPLTRIIGVYLEDVKDGRRFFELLRLNGARKPVVLLIGGRTAEGRRAAASHTGALAADERIWLGVARQTGAVLVDTVDELLDALVALQYLKPHVVPTERVLLFGNGGGASVLATDYFARYGLHVPPLPAAVQEALRALKLPAGSSLANPVDTPAGTLKEQEGRVAGQILRTIFAGDVPDALVLHLNFTPLLGFTDPRIDVLGNLLEVVLSVQEEYADRIHVVLVLRSDGYPEVEERKRQGRETAIRRGMPVFDELDQAARALRVIQWYERFGTARGGQEA